MPSGPSGMGSKGDLAGLWTFRTGTLKRLLAGALFPSLSLCFLTWFSAAKPGIALKQQGQTTL
jgi:hypothetical protein